MRKRVSKKDLAIAKDTLSPDAVNVLRDFRRKSRGQLTRYREEKPIETIRVRTCEAPAYSGERNYKTISLPRVRFLEAAE
jgi:hypothetical protein